MCDYNSKQLGIYPDLEPNYAKSESTTVNRTPFYFKNQNVVPNPENISGVEMQNNLNNYLRTQIGKDVDVDFLVGSTNIYRKSGKIVGVGQNYILLLDDLGNIVACDFYNIKFVTIIQS